MISAIAARKAAKAASVAPSPVVASETVNDAPPLTLPEDGSLSTSSSDDDEVVNALKRSPPKRKLAQDSLPKSRKRQRLVNAVPATEQEILPHLRSPNGRPQVAKGDNKSARGFSPSRLIDVGDGSEDISDPESPTDRLESQPASLHSAAGTYVRRDSINFFSLSDEDKAALHLELDPAILLALQPNETVSFTGTARLTVRRGSVELLGTVVGPSKTAHSVFAPRSHPIPVVTALPASSVVSSAEQLELPETFQNKFSTDDVVIVLQELKAGVEGLGRVCGLFDGVFDALDDADWGLDGFHPLTRDAWNVQPFILPSLWDVALSSFVPSVAVPMAPEEAMKARVALVKGIKNSGKSTFARTLLNRLVGRYQRVAFLECDVGQSEFTPPGLVSLHVLSQPIFGPPFTHPCAPLRAHYIGSSTPRSDPTYYMSAIESLLQTYRLELQFIPPADLIDDDRISDVVPLVINTMGWTKGLGATLGQQVEEMASPTHIFDFSDQSERPWSTPATTYPESHEAPQWPASGAGDPPEVHVLAPVQPSSLQTQYNAASLRTLSILSYLHCTEVPSTASPPRWSTAVPLCGMPPWEVDWKVAFDRVVLIGPGSEDVVPEEIETVLNAALVAFIAVDDTSDIQGSGIGQATALPYVQGAEPPSPSSSHCVGLGLIRSIARGAQHLHILTPLPSSALASCRVLVKGELELPIWGFLDFREEEGHGVAGVEWSKVPFLEWGRGQGIGGEKRRVRRNLMRKNQM